MEDIILSVSSPPEIDIDVFACWVEGKSFEEAANFKIDQNRKTGTFFGLEFSRAIDNLSMDQGEFIRYEVLDQFRMYQVLEHYLCYPALIQNQSLCIVTSDLQITLIDKYWSLDDLFVREFLNKKLTKSRKDLEDISETTGLNLRRVTRQFDNIKRVYTTFEDSSNLNDNIYSFITNNFLLSSNLCKKYACITFLMYSKFNLTSKRRIQRVSCESLECCAALILTFLATESSMFFRLLSNESSSEIELLESNSKSWNFVWKIFGSVDSFELDKQLLQSLRDLRTLLTGDLLDSGCNLVRSKLGMQLARKIEGNNWSAFSKLRSILKALLLIGANLSQSREYRDLFEDIVTKIAEPLEESGCSIAEMNSVLSCCYYVINDLNENNPQSRQSSMRPDTSMRTDISVSTQSTVIKSATKIDHLKKDWLRFIVFCRLCLLQLVSSDRRS